MKKFTTLLSILFISLQLSAQHNLGVKLNYGMVNLGSYFKAVDQNDIAYKTGPAYEFGLTFKHNFKENQMLSVEVLYSSFNTKESADITWGTFFTDWEPLLSDNQATITANHKMSYLALPITFGFKMRQFRLDLGVQGNLIVALDGEYTIDEVINNVRSVTTDKFDYNQLNRVDMGIKLRLSYAINERFSIDVSHYHGLFNMNDVQNDFSPEGFSTNQFARSYSLVNKQFLIGVQYDFWKD